MHSLYDGENIYSRRENAVFMKRLKVAQDSCEGNSAMMRFIVLHRVRDNGKLLQYLNVSQHNNGAFIILLQ